MSTRAQWPWLRLGSLLYEDLFHYTKTIRETQIEQLSDKPVKQHELSARDHQFRSAFGACSVAPLEFNHAAHVRLAYIHLVGGDTDSASALFSADARQSFVEPDLDPIP